MQEFFEVKKDEIWLKPFAGYEARVVAPAGESLDKTLEWLGNNFEKFEKKVKDVIQKIDATQNKGSFLVQLQNFKTQMGEMAAIGDFAPLLEQIEQYEKEIEALIQQNRERNLEIKKALLEEVKIVSDSTSWKKAGEELNSIRMRWKKTGSVDPEINQQIEEEFQSYMDKFYEARNEFFKESEEAIESYQELIDQSKALFSSVFGDSTEPDHKKEETEEKKVAPEEEPKPQSAKANPTQVVSDLKKLQAEWKNLPPIPKNRYSELFKEFSKVHDDFFNLYKEQVEQNKKAKRAERTEKSMKIKRELVEKAKSLSESAPDKYMEAVKNLRKEWKDSGYVPNEISDEVWADFNYWIEKLIENKRLERMVREKAEKDALDEKEVIREKLKHLKRLVRKEKESLEKINSNMGAFRINHKSKEFGQVLDSKAKEQERKWQVKRDIIRELEAELS